MMDIADHLFIDIYLFDIKIGRKYKISKIYKI